MVSVFAEINSLPSPQQQSAVLEGNIDTTAQKTAFDMGGHIVRAFQSMKIVIGRLRHQNIEMGFKILPDGWIGIFVKGQTGWSMFDKHIQHPTHLGQFFTNVSGDQMKAPRKGRKANFFLKNHVPYFMFQWYLIMIFLKIPNLSHFKCKLKTYDQKKYL